MCTAEGSDMLMSLFMCVVSSVALMLVHGPKSATCSARRKLSMAGAVDGGGALGPHFSETTRSSTNAVHVCVF